MLKDRQDAHGHEIYDYLNGKGGYEIVERDDGYFDVSGGPKAYFDEFKDWKTHEKKAIRYVRGKILDIGCGAGRCLIYLRQKGFDVMGIDTSPLAIRVCKERGLRNVKLLSITQVSSKLGIFDTILMYGGNFGLAVNPQRARWLFKRFHKMTSERARIITGTLDPYRAPSKEHLQYHMLNRKRGRMPGQNRIRVRYKKYTTPWFDWLRVSQKEMADILRGTGWEARKFINSQGTCYAAIIEKER